MSDDLYYVAWILIIPYWIAYKVFYLAQALFWVETEISPSSE